MKKTVKVVMLATEKATSISILQSGKLWYATDDRVTLNHQHLYLISDDEIKEGDWVTTCGAINDGTVSIAKYEKDLLGVGKKIIATTDKLASGKCMEDRCLLHPCDGKCCLPQIPESFIQAYIKAYNEGNPITEVNVSYEETPRTPGSKDTIWVVQTRADNTVIIHQAKMYTKDEVVKLLQAVCVETYRDSLFEVTDKWIQDNL